jgi:hypothetical protein
VEPPKAVGWRSGYLPYLGFSDQTTSGGVFTGGENVEYIWKSHRWRLQVALFRIMMLKNTALIGQRS